MRAKNFKYWHRVRSSFWFLPAIMAAGAVALAFVSVAFDKRVATWLAHNWGLTFNGGAEGASSVLGIIAGSMITIAGVVFSMTLVALSLASSQLGPRLLRTFMRDTTTQVVLGVFVASFLYCLLVLRTIRRVEEIAFVPHLSVTLGVLFAVGSVGVLIYFIHHVSVSIQANEIVARVSKELIEGIDRLYPQDLGQASRHMPREAPEASFLDAFDREARPIGARGDGYLQFIDEESLIALTMTEDVIIRLGHRPGQYVVAHSPICLVWPGNRVTEQLVDQLKSVFVLGNQQTASQDIEFAVNQLVEIAVRALSPGINDPFTAIACVDRLGSALCRLATRDTPSPYRYDSQNQLRVIAPANTFPLITDAAFNQIRQYGRSSAAVTIRLLETIAVVAGFAHRQEDRAALRRHVEMIARGALEGLLESEDRRQVDDRYKAACDSCSESVERGS